MTDRFSRRRKLLLLIGIFLASACSPPNTSKPFIPPTGQAPLIQPTLIIIPTTTTDQVRVIPLLPTTVPTVDRSNCVNDLSFIEDLTIPDNSFIPFGASIDKQWLIENSGTCNWDSEYRLRYTGGALLGAQEEIALFPAKSGTQVTVQITFTAPFEEGLYESAWQAFDPNGLAFGDPIYLQILVSP